MDLDGRVREKNAAFEMRCLAKVIEHLLKDHATTLNEDVRRMSQTAAGALLALIGRGKDTDLV